VKECLIIIQLRTASFRNPPLLVPEIFGILERQREPEAIANIHPRFVYLCQCC
jgi:hypothetical protein